MINAALVPALWMIHVTALPDPLAKVRSEAGRPTYGDRRHRAPMKAMLRPVMAVGETWKYVWVLLEMDGKVSH